MQSDDLGGNRDSAGVAMHSAIEAYLARVGEVLAALPREPLVAITKAILRAGREGHMIYALGNGGSAATASHLACDLAKTAGAPGQPPLRAIALTDNIPMLTAYGNDISFESVFAEQVRTFARPGDLVIAISASGNSPNILAAAAAARELGAVLIGVTGFGGGRLQALCDICLVTPSNAYGPVEDIHMIVVHTLLEAIRSARQTELPAHPPSDLVTEHAPGPPRVLLPAQHAESSTASTIFLDRDGVINRNRADYVKSWAEFEFLPGALAAIAQLTRAGHRLLVVTNQACVERGLVPLAAVEDAHTRMVQAIAQAGGHIEAVLWCPHRPESHCMCRKPNPGLLFRARDEYGVDLNTAIFVGDSASDMQAAAAAGVRRLLVLTGLGWPTALHLPDKTLAETAVALNLRHAARLIRRDGLAAPATPWLRGAIHAARALRGDARVDTASSAAFAMAESGPSPSQVAPSTTALPRG